MAQCRFRFWEPTGAEGTIASLDTVCMVKREPTSWVCPDQSITTFCTQVLDCNSTVVSLKCTKNKTRYMFAHIRVNLRTFFSLLFCYVNSPAPCWFHPRGFLSFSHMHMQYTHMGCHSGTLHCEQSYQKRFHARRYLIHTSPFFSCSSVKVLLDRSKTATMHASTAIMHAVCWYHQGVWLEELKISLQCLVSFSHFFAKH